MTKKAPPTTNLEKGIYYEPAKKRYRVRTYKNNCVHFGGYHPTYEKALTAWHEVKKKLTNIPKNPRNVKTIKKAHNPNIEGLGTALKEEKYRNPSAMRVGKKK